ncbi:MAG: enolase C-terminal domain-like protein, partial [Rhodococcus sp. (in: high G+C Gram-positive bacteria)]
YALDAASSHFYNKETGTYTVAGKDYNRDELIEFYLELIRDFGIVSIEDPLDEDDFEGFVELTKASGIQIVGDDLFTTNPARLAQGLEVGAANSLLWKVNQIGTLSEAFDAAHMATGAGYTVVVSERSGETEDPIISDLVVALGAGQIKTGAPVRGERTSKYNRLLQIEEELGATATYPGRSFQKPA